jgi:predicted nucleic acid-binding protein
MFWDSSALVPLLVSERRSSELVALLRSDPAPAMWWATPVECQSALRRRRREDALEAPTLARALDRLRQLTEDVDAVAPTVTLREAAGRALAAHPLRAGDALQLAAALVWSGKASGEPFVCLDDGLRDAARREGFTVVPEA